MEIKLKGRVLPRNEKGDVCFTTLEAGPLDAVRNIFTDQEIVELVNRALYQLEYQRESHRKRGQAQRDQMKELKKKLKESGIDPKTHNINKQLKGE
jgi:hypothetical protein